MNKFLIVVLAIVAIFSMLILWHLGREETPMSDVWTKSSSPIELASTPKVLFYYSHG